MKNKIRILVMAAMMMTACACGTSTQKISLDTQKNVDDTADSQDEDADEEDIELTPSEEAEIEFSIDDEEYSEKMSMGDLNGDGTEDYITVTFGDDDTKTFGDEYGNIVNVWLDGSKIFEYQDEIPVCAIRDDFSYKDFDGDGEEEIYVSFEPMVNSMPLIEYLVLKEQPEGWTALNLINDSATLDENGSVTNSLPISVIRTGKEPVFDIKCEGYDKKIRYDATSHYETKVLESESNEYECNVYKALLTGDESLYEFALSDGCTAAWGIWEIEVGEYKDNTCLIAEQGIQGPYGKFDGFGEIYISFNFDSNGKINVLNLDFVQEGQPAEAMPAFYISEITDEIFERINGKSYKEDCIVPREDLRYLHLMYKNLDGDTYEGELIVNEYIAEDVLEIFKTLYEADYPFERIRLIDEYEADDDLSILNNNTSAFNYRCIGSTNKISKHGLGLAIDINPFYNPYITTVNGKQQVDPEAAEEFADRSRDFAYKIDENDLLYKLFTEKGFAWGGHWKNTKDYQHFEIKTDVVKSLYPQWNN